MKKLSFSVCELKCLHNLLLNRNIKNSALVIKKVEDALSYYSQDADRSNNKIIYNVSSDENYFSVSIILNEIEIDVFRELAREYASDIENQIKDNSKYRFN